MEKKIDLSIVIVSWNVKDLLKKCLTSIYENSQNISFEIFVVDNASSDGTVQMVKDEFPQVYLIENKKNLGFAKASNQGAKIARGRYLFFLNNDTKIDKKALVKLVEKMQKDKKIGICGCQVRSYDGRRVFHKGIGVDIFGYPIVWKKTFYVEGSALMIRKSLFKKLGGFDDDYFMFHEDIDLCWRCWLLGFKVVAVPSATVYHFVGAASGGRPKFKGQYKTTPLRRFFSEKNNLVTLLKNYETKTLIFILPLYFFVNLLEIFLYLVTLRWEIALLYPRAYLENMLDLKKILGKRAAVKKQRKIPDGEIIKKMYFGSAKFFSFQKVGIPILKG